MKNLPFVTKQERLARPHDAGILSLTRTTELQRIIIITINKGYRTSSMIHFCMDQQLHLFRRTCESDYDDTIVMHVPATSLYKRESEYDLRDQNAVTLPNFKTITYGRKYFRYCGAHVWNSVLPHIRSAPTLKSFKEVIKS